MAAASGQEEKPRADGAANRRYFSRSRKTSHIRGLVLNLALVALPVAVYYFAVIQEQAQDDRARAFRALAEMEQRIANYFEVARAYQPASYSATPLPGSSLIDRRVGDLGLEGLVDSSKDPRVIRAGKASCRPGSLEQAPFRAELLTGQAGSSQFQLYRCGQAGDRFQSAVSFPLSAPLRSFRDLREFDHVIVAAPGGATLAIHGSTRDAVALGRSIQQGDRISGVATPRNVKDILKLAALESWTRNQARFAASKDARAAPEHIARDVLPVLGASPDDVVEIHHEIGGQRYTIQIKPYHLPIPAVMSSTVAVSAPAAAEPVDALYLIGFRALSTWDLPSRAIDPLGAWFLAATILVFLLASPLIRLVLLESHDSVTRARGRLVAVSSVGLAGLLALIVLSLMAYLTLTAFLRSGAANYSHALLITLRAEMGEVLSLLDAQRDYYDGREPWVPLRQVSMPSGEVARVLGLPEACSKGRDALNYSRVARNAACVDGTRSWSPLDSSIQVERNGLLSTRGLVFGQCEPPLPRIHVNHREYFQSLYEGRAWAWHRQPIDSTRAMEPSQDRSGCTVAAPPLAPFDGPYVAQRLFNLRNGKKSMQFAIPRQRPVELSSGGSSTPFGGIVAGNAPMYPFTLAVPPLEFGFAVFDQATGTVLLHDDDSRSLVENLYLETEQDVRLLAAVGHTLTIDHGAVHAPRATVENLPRVMTEWPSGIRVSAAVALQPRQQVSIPLPLQGQIGVTNWEPIVWLLVVMLALGLPLIALVVVLVGRLTGLAPARNAKPTGYAQPLASSTIMALADAMAAKLGGAPRILFVDDDTALPSPHGDHRSAIERAVDAVHRFFPASAAALSQGHVRVDLLQGDLSLRYERLYSHVLLAGLDVALAAGSEKRLAVLDLIERLVAAEGVQTFILSDFLPMGPLTLATGYPRSELPDIDLSEAARWRHVFSRLHWWALGEHRKRERTAISGDDLDACTPVERRKRMQRMDLLDQVEDECSVLWPRLERLRRNLRADVDAGRVTMAEQIAERVFRHSRGLLSRMWLLATVAERLALYQLAKGEIPNPRYPDTLSALAVRGLVRYKPAPQIASKALERFVLEAEAPSVFAEWQDDAAQGVWQSLRGPLVLIILLLVAWLSYSAGQVFAALAAVLTSTLSFAGNIFSAANLLKGSSGGGKS